MGRDENCQSVQCLVEEAEIDTGRFRAQEHSGITGTKGLASEVQVTRNQPKIGRGRSKRFGVLAVVIPVVFLTLFFEAPIVPVAYTRPASCGRECTFGGYGPDVPRLGGRPCPGVNYTGWQSLGYHLFEIGYYDWTPQSWCLE